MTNLHKIRARIRSVNSTQQITRTMKMIAVSKLRKTQTSLAGVRLFADKSQAVLNALLAELDAKIAAESDPKKKAKLEAEKATKEQWLNAIK